MGTHQRDCCISVIITASGTAREGDQLMSSRKCSNDADRNYYVYVGLPHLNHLCIPSIENVDSTTHIEIYI